MSQKFATGAEYFASFSGETKERLQQLRAVVLSEAPNAEEKISYNIPAYFKGKKMICYIAGYAQHVSIYPGRIAGEKYEKKFGNYLSGKSTLKFPNDQPLPIELAKEFVRLRLSEVAAEGLK